MSFSPERRRLIQQIGGSLLALGISGAFPAIVQAERNQTLDPSARPSIIPYLVYPSDRQPIPEYDVALMDGLQTVQIWYQEQIGKTFTIAAPPQAIFSYKDYLGIRCGDTPNAECLTDPNIVSPAMWMEAVNAITGNRGNSLRLYKDRVIVAGLIGSGGLSQGGNFSPNAGYAVLGDWYLQAFSGISNDWGISCSNNPYGGVAGWICTPETAALGIAHELGHAFGLRHPNETPNPSSESTIMSGDLAANKFSSLEVALLQQSPFLS